MLIKKFEKILLFGRGWNFFTPYRYQQQNNTLNDAFIILNTYKDGFLKHLLLVKLIVKYIFFWSNISLFQFSILKATTKALTVELLRIKPLKGAANTLVILFWSLPFPGNIYVMVY